MPINFDRNVCWNIEETISREWLVTNGLGGYAAGTVAGTLTRAQHGLLVTSPREASTPYLLLAKMDEEVVFDQRTYYLGTNEYKDGTLNPAGYVHLESFRLEEGFPVFTYHLGGIDGIVLEKRIWMPQGLDTTYIHYRVLRTTPSESVNQPESRFASHSRAARLHEDVHAAQRMLSLTLLPLASYRPYNALLHSKHDQQFQVETQHLEQDSLHQNQSIAGCSIRAHDTGRGYAIFAVGHPASQTTFLPTGVWYWNFLHREELAAGRTATDDLYLPGVFRTKLWPGEDSELTIIVTTEDISWQTFDAQHIKRAYAAAVEYQKDVSQERRYFGDGGIAARSLPVLPLAGAESKLSSEEFQRLLLQAGNRFLSQRTLPNDERDSHLAPFFGATRTVPILLSGFYDMQDRTRDTLIALPGLLLSTQRYAEARRILSNLGHYFSKGMLPDRLPTLDSPLTDEDYGSIDTTLWYFYALDAYLRATQDYTLLEDQYEHLEESIEWTIRGTRHGIQASAEDGLLRASPTAKALTWMNAVVDNVPLTPRSGAAVEVNALWYLALSLMHEWSGQLYQHSRVRRITPHYQELRQQCKHSFNERFWYEAGGYLYDVIDGPSGNDASLRPNQLFALSLRYPVLGALRRQAVLNEVAEHLLTPFGLRSLAPTSQGYQGYIKGRGRSSEEIQRALYNGGTWCWLLGAYIDALHALERQRSLHNAPISAHSSTRCYGLELLASIREQLTTSLLSSPGSVYDGDTPHTVYGQLTCARSTGEILRIYQLLSHTQITSANQAMTR